jgi:hypothetical protein
MSAYSERRLSFEPVVCAQCGESARRTSNAQRFCGRCAGRRYLAPRAAGRSKNRASASSIFWSASESIDIVRMLRVSVPFTWFFSKNWLHQLAGRRDGKKAMLVHDKCRAARGALADRIRAANAGEAWPRRKTYIDILVQKPRANGDAVNVVDVVCDAVADGIGVDDRWFAIRRLDWEVVKAAPRLYVGIGQDGEEPQQICSACGLLLDVSRFHKNRADLLGYARICIACRTTPRPRAQRFAPGVVIRVAHVPPEQASLVERTP